MPGSRAPIRRRDFDSLARLVAQQKSPHQLVSSIAADSRLLAAVRRILHNRSHLSSAERGSLQEACRSVEITPEYLEKRLRVVAHLLNLPTGEPDLYETLGLDPSAGKEAIKNAFRRLSLVYHPDRNPQGARSVDQWHRIHNAYKILSDDGLRRDYDGGARMLPWKEEIPSEEPIEAKSRWRKVNNAWQLGLLLCLLFVFIFLIDYQDWILNRYYSEKPHPPMLAGKGSSALIPDTSPSRSSPGPSSPAAEPVQPLPAENSPGQPPSPEESGSSGKAEQQSPDVPQGKDARKTLTGEEGNGGNRPAPPVSSKQESGRLSIRDPSSRVRVSPRGDAAQGADPGRKAREAVDPSAQVSRKIADFITRYTLSYEKRDLAAFLSCFERDALENGIPLRAALEKHHHYFQKAQWIYFRIQPEEWVTSGGDEIEVRGRMRLYMQFAPDTFADNSGSVHLRLTSHGNRFLIKELNYRFQ